MLKEKDLDQLRAKGISVTQIESQLDSFANGFPYLEIEAAASIEKGVMRISEKSIAEYVAAWAHYLEGAHEILKFVPASGAASRMFKDLFEFVEAGYEVPTTAFEKKFFEQLEQFAFYTDLSQACQSLFGQDAAQLLLAGQYKSIVKALLEGNGLNYGSLPKGLLKFHASEEGARTPMEEHLVEGALYAANNEHLVKVHFTVSPEHRPLFERLVNEKIASYESTFGVTYDVSFSEQKTSTDTIAADEFNQPFRDKEALLFRPGGHGALIENLNDISADVIFVKNIV